MTAASRYDYQFDPTDQSTAARICRLIGANRQVLELGCAAGAMSAVLKHHYACEVTGVEYDPSAARAAAAHCDDVVVTSLDDAGWLERLPAGRRYDAVLAADVLEHLRDPARCLRQLHTLLPAEGSLVVSVPNIAHSGVLASLLCGDFNYVDTGLLDRTHIHFFTTATLRRMLDECGYDVLHHETADAGSWHPEFKRYWQALPAELHAWLESNPAGAAYQTIMVAQPRTGTHAGHSAPETPSDQQAGWLATWPGQPVPDAQAANQLEPGVPQAEYEALRASHAAMQTELEALWASRSWRITAPLRSLARLFGKSK